MRDLFLKTLLLKHQKGLKLAAGASTLLSRHQAAGCLTSAGMRACKLHSTMGLPGFCQAAKYQPCQLQLQRPPPRRWLRRTDSRARPRSAPPSSLSRSGSVAAAGIASQAQDDVLLEEVIRTATRRQQLVPQQEQQELAGVDVRRTRRR